MKKRINRRPGHLALLALLATACGAIAQPQITGVTIEDFSTEFPNRNAVDTVNSSGLSGGAHNTGVGNMWLSNNEETPVITFDLEGNFDLDRFHVWNYNEVNLSNRSANLVEILVATSVGGPFTSLGDFTFAMAPGANGYTGETIDLSGFLLADNARLVRFNIKSDHGGDNFTGLSEVQFFGTVIASAPEAIDDHVTFSENVAPNSGNGLGNLDSLAAGTHPFTAGGQTFTGLVEQHDGNGWLLIGRGQEDWDFDTDGQGSTAEVSQNLGSFVPAAYSDLLVNQLLAQAGLTMAGVEIRLKRANQFTLDGNEQYQDVRWRDFTGNANAFTFDFDGSPFNLTQEILDLGGLPGQQQGLLIATDTNDNLGEGAGEDGDRTFTFSFQNQRGFSYGGQIGYLTPYTEVYIRPRSNAQAGILANDTDANGDLLTVTGAATSGVPTPGTLSTTSVLGAPVVVSPNGTFTYDLSDVAAAQLLLAGETLADSFTYLADDGTGRSDSATVNITIQGVSDLVNDSATVGEDGPAAPIDVLANDAAAGVLISGVTIEDFSSQFPNREAVDAINGSGLTGETHNVAPTEMWLSNNEETPVITFDLEAHYDLGQLKIWNYNEANFSNRSANEVEILVSPDANVGNLVKLVNPTGPNGNFTFQQAPGANGYPGFDLDLGGVSNPAALLGARLVRFDIKSDHSGDNFTGLSEVRFFAQTPLSITGVSPNTDGGPGGTVTITNGGADLAYDPNGQFESLNDGDTATDTFSYTTSNGKTASVSVTINGITDLIPPTANPDPLTRPRNNNFVTIAIGQLLDNDLPATGTIAFDAIDVSGTRGTVTVVPPRIYYQPVAGDFAPDSFSYTIRETPGDATATTTATITPDSAEQTQQVDRAFILSGTNFELHFIGVPGTGYTIQFSPDMVSWSDIGSVIADPLNGRYSLTHDPGVATAYFRSVFRP